MKNVFKIFSVVAAASVLLSCTFGCAKNEGGEQDISSNIKAEDMPFGSTLVTLNSKNNSNVKISIDYDDRYITEEEAIKLSDYVASLNSCDAELMESTVYPPYLSFIVENTGYSTTEEYIQDVLDSIETKYTGEGIDMDYIVINSFHDENDDDSTTGFSNLDSQIYALADSGSAPEIKSRKMLGIDIIYSINGEGSYLLSHRTDPGSDSCMDIYIYNIDGENYILF